MARPIPAWCQKSFTVSNARFLSPREAPVIAIVLLTTDIVEVESELAMQKFMYSPIDSFCKPDTLVSYFSDNGCHPKPRCQFLSKWVQIEARCK